MKKSEEIALQIEELQRLQAEAIAEENQKPREVIGGTSIKRLNGIRCSGCALVAAIALEADTNWVPLSKIDRIMSEVCDPAFAKKSPPSSSPATVLEDAGLILRDNGSIKATDSFYSRKALSELIDPELKKQVSELMK